MNAGTQPPDAHNREAAARAIRTRHARGPTRRSASRIWTSAAIRRSRLSHATPLWRDRRRGLPANRSPPDRTAAAAAPRAGRPGPVAEECLNRPESPGIAPASTAGRASSAREQLQAGALPAVPSAPTTVIAPRRSPVRVRLAPFGKALHGGVFSLALAHTAQSQCLAPGLLSELLRLALDKDHLRDSAVALVHQFGEQGYLTLRALLD
jgi:hypothetical protein